MKKIPLVFVFVFVCCGSVVLLWGLPKLLPLTIRESPMVLNDLLVNVDVFPSVWQVEGVPEGEPRGSDLDWGEENMVIRFQPTGHQGYATHYIFKFRNAASAKYGLFWIKRQGFLTPSTRKSLDGWSYESPIADDWLFGCTDEIACTALARYDEFISVFRTSINPQYMTLDDLETILKAIDVKMSEYVGIIPK